MYVPCDVFLLLIDTEAVRYHFGHDFERQISTLPA